MFGLSLRLKTLGVGLCLALTLLCGCAPQLTEVAQGQAHLVELRRSGLVAAGTANLTLGEVQRITTVPTRWSRGGEVLCWAELRSADGAAGYLAWSAAAPYQLLDFSIESLTAIDLPQAKALSGVPGIQQFAIIGPAGEPVASGCVPTAGASLIAYWSNRGTYDWQADDSPEGLVRRVRDRLPMAVLPDVEGYTDGRMALAGCSPNALAVGLQADAVQYRIPVAVTVAAFDRRELAKEIAASRPALVSCTVLVPRKPTLSWGHQVVAVGQAEVSGRHYVGIIDNFYVPRVPGTVRWIAEEQCSALLTVRPQ